MLKDLQENVANAETKVISLFLAFSCLLSVDEFKRSGGAGRCMTHVFTRYQSHTGIKTPFAIKKLAITETQQTTW